MLTASNKVYLFDFDGVLYKNKRASWYVSKRSSQFVHEKMRLPGQYLSYQSEAINEHLYKTFGHTAVGLQKLGYDVSPKEFNDFVYSNMPYTAFEMEEPLNIRLAPNVFIFSNAPKEYVNSIAKQDLPNIRDHLPSSISELLKPNKTLTEAITQLFHKKQIIFIDDSMANFRYSLENPNWVNLLYVENSCMLRLGDNLIATGEVKINDML